MLVDLSVCGVSEIFIFVLGAFGVTGTVAEPAVKGRALKVTGNPRDDMQLRLRGRKTVGNFKERIGFEEVQIC